MMKNWFKNSCRIFNTIRNQLSSNIVWFIIDLAMLDLKYNLNKKFFVLSLLFESYTSIGGPFILILKKLAVSSSIL